jgi:hypothetical protein
MKWNRPRIVLFFLFFIKAFSCKQSGAIVSFLSFLFIINFIPTEWTINGQITVLKTLEEDRWRLGKGRLKIEESATFVSIILIRDNESKEVVVLSSWKGQRAIWSDQCWQDYHFPTLKLKLLAIGPENHVRSFLNHSYLHYLSLS